MEKIKFYFEREGQEYVKELELIRTSYKNRDLYDELVKPMQDKALKLTSKLADKQADQSEDYQKLYAEWVELKKIMLFDKCKLIVNSKQLNTHEKEQWATQEFWENQDLTELEKADDSFRNVYFKAKH